MPGGVINPKGRTNLTSTARDMTPAERLDTSKTKRTERKSKGISFVIKILSDLNPFNPFRGKSMDWIAKNHPDDMRKLLSNSSLKFSKEIRASIFKKIK